MGEQPIRVLCDRKTSVSVTDAKFVTLGFWMHPFYYALFSLTVLTLFPALSRAHGIGLEVRLAGTRVTLEAFYDDNTPVVDAKTRLLHLEGGVVGEGRTDVQGAWEFQAPPPGRYKVEVRTEDGHFSRTTIAIPEPGAGREEPTTVGAKVSEGESREDRTGYKKWAKAILGLAVILAGAFGLQWFKKQGAIGVSQDPTKPGGANHD